MSQVSAKVVRVELEGRDLIEVTVPQDGSPSRWKVVACTEVMTLLKKFKNQYHDFRNWPEPMGITHGEILLRELILKFKDQWSFPYEHEELCHCRMVPTKTVDQAIIAGAHTTQQVSRQTSASTACGTCRPDVEKILSYRLRKV